MQSQETLLRYAVDFAAQHMEIPAVSVDPEADLKSMGLDSFRIIEMVLFLERKSGFVLPDHEYTPANLKSLSSIVSAFLKLES